MNDTDDIVKFRGITQKVIDELNEQMEHREQTYNFWRCLKRANEDYLELDPTGEGTFREFMEANYGIKIYHDNNGQMLGTFDIVNESLYTFFKLKYTR